MSSVRINAAIATTLGVQSRGSIQRGAVRGKRAALAIVWIPFTVPTRRKIAAGQCSGLRMDSARKGTQISETSRQYESTMHFSNVNN